MSNQYLSFDVTKQSAPQQLITGRQGDSQLKFVTMLFWDGDKNVPYDLTGKRVAFEALKPDNTHIVDYEGITVLDAPAGLVRYSFNEQVFSVAGTMQQAFFKITHTDSNKNVIAD
ncbi:BppU family phage baseplate upper protein, partial [Leuconostoc mesenteroides]|uniref:BppU family phage baseplate upper protein n=1 Tax=Leuconostoc mesenteroides TaxID=1245 RepID=UPI002360A37A